MRQSIWGNNNKDQYTGVAACLNCMWSNINHCLYIHWHCIGHVSNHCSRPTPSIDGQMGQAIWGRPFRETTRQGPIQRHGRLSELYSIECYIFSLTFNSFLIINVNSFASQTNEADQLSGVASLMTNGNANALALPFVIIVCNHRNITQSRLCLMLSNKWYINIVWYLTIS